MPACMLAVRNVFRFMLALLGSHNVLLAGAVVATGFGTIARDAAKAATLESSASGSIALQLHHGSGTFPQGYFNLVRVLKLPLL